MNRAFQTLGNPKNRRRNTFSLFLLPVLAFASPAFAQTPPAPNLAAARTLFDTLRGEDALRGSGNSIGYALSHGGIVATSLVVRRNGVLLREGLDYTLDAPGGILKLVHAATPDETLIVSYRYTPGAAGLTGQSGARVNGFISGAPTYAAGLPTMNFGKLGLGFVRGDGGSSTNALLHLDTPGLAFFSGGSGLSSQARSLTGEKPDPAAALAGDKEYLVSQNRVIGGKGAQITLDYQNVSKNFGNFAALRQMQSEKSIGGGDLVQMEKERGLKRQGVGIALGVRSNASLNLSQNTLSGGGGDIARQSLALSDGGLSLTMNSLSVDRKFTRWKDLADRDLLPGMNRDQFEKNMKGVTKRDLGGKWLLGNGLSFEGGTADWSRDNGDGKANNQRDTHWLANFAPTKDITFQALQETSAKTVNDKAENKTVRGYSVASNAKRPTSLSYLTRTTQSGDAAGKMRRETQSRIDGKTLLRLPKRTLPGLVFPALTFNGARETLVTDEGDKSATHRTDTIATLFGVRTDDTGALRFAYEEKSRNARPDSGDATVNHARTTNLAWQIRKSALFSYMNLADDTVTGAAKTEIAKQNIAFNFGRGYSYTQSLDKNLTADSKGATTELRTDSLQFATDPHSPIWAAGERKATQGAADANETLETWRSGLNMGGLTLKVDGMGIRRLNMRSLLHNEKNINVVGALKLFGGWTARYNFYDRAGKDPQTKLDRDEMLREWTLDSGTKSPLKIGFVNRTFENRYTKQAERVRQETTLAPLKRLGIGFLKGGNLTLAYGTDRMLGTERQGETRKLIYDGTLGGNRLALEWGSGRDANGLLALSKAFTFTTKAGGSLQLTTRQGLREASSDEHSRQSQWSRAWDIAFHVRKNQTLTYSLAVRPEKPDTTWEARQAEAVGYTFLFGGGGKLCAEYKSARDFLKNTGSRSTLLSLVSPASATTSYEFSYLKETTMLSEKRGEMNTYIVAYQYLPTDKPLSVTIGARWFDYGGDLPIPFQIKDRTAGTIEIKGVW